MFSRKYRPLHIAIVVLLILAVGGYLYWDQWVRGIVATDDARLAATSVDLAPQINGRLVELPVDEGDQVKKGDLLFRLDDRDIVARIHSAEARLPGLEAQVRVAEANLRKANGGARPEEIKIARTAANEQRALVAQATRQVDRTRRLVNAGVKTREALENQQTNAKLARRRLDEASQKVQLLENGARDEDIDAAQAALDIAKAHVSEAQAELERARLALSYATVYAPFDGVVMRTWKNNHENVSPAAPVVTLMKPESLHVNANIEETELEDVALGDEVEIDIDAFPDLHLSGHVVTIMDGTRSEFSLVPSEGVTGAFIKVTQRVPIQVTLDDIPSRDTLHYMPGLSVELRIHSHTGEETRNASRP